MSFLNTSPQCLPPATAGDGALKQSVFPPAGATGPAARLTGGKKPLSDILQSTRHPVEKEQIVRNIYNIAKINYN